MDVRFRDTGKDDVNSLKNMFKRNGLDIIGTVTRPISSQNLVSQCTVIRSC